MAITKIHAIKSTLGKALAYIENPDKTDGQMLVSGYNCEPQTASIDFEMTAVLAHKARNLKRKRSTNLAYHLIQSFSPEDAVPPEQAHELGKKLAFEYTGGKYEYVVATHIDKGHIHNHIMINAVSFYDYKKLRTVPYRTARQIRDISDRLCMEAHLSVIDDPQKIGQLYPENAGKKKSVSNRTEIRKRLNFCLERATDYSQFLSMAKELEITPTIRGKHISYLLEGAGRAVRDNSLSDTDTFTYEIINVEGLLQSSIQEQRPKARLDMHSIEAALSDDASFPDGKIEPGFLDRYANRIVKSNNRYIWMLQLMNVQQIMPIQSERQPIAMVTYKSGVPYDIEQEQIGKQDKESAGPDCATICRPQDFFLNMGRTKRKRKLVEWLESCQENQVSVLDEKIPLLSFAVDFVTAYEYQKARGIKIHPGLWRDMRVDIFLVKKEN